MDLVQSDATIVSLALLGLEAESVLAERPNKTGRPNPFRFEMRAATTVADKRYFTMAPVQTDVDLQLLEKLEGML